MKRILKYYKPFLVAIIVSICLLFVQAICDLKLPDFMADIVNIGIQTAGIEDVDPKAVSEDAINLMKTFMTDENKQIVDNSNLIMNNFNNLDNSILLESIYKLQTMENNLYMATEGFGDDDIFNILMKIRTYLDYENCSMTSEYYVIREADCPSGSTKLTTSIYNTTGVNHCYIIQNLTSTTQAAYANSGCQTANTYINLAIPFIKEIYSNVVSRSVLLQSYQNSYSNTFKALYNEITSISNKINNTYNLLYTNSSDISKCSSVRFDLIDFSDFIGVTTEYDARIVVIFSAFDRKTFILSSRKSAFFW